MKNKSSLFFWFSIIIICLFFYTIGYTQKSHDSIGYYQNLITQPKTDSDLTNSYDFFSRRNLKSEKRNDTIAMIFNYYQLSRIEYKVGQYVESENTAVEALRLLDLSESTSYTRQLKKNLINQLGLLYREQQNFLKAKDLYSEALQIAENARDSAMLYNNISNTYKDSKDFQKAFSELKMAYDLIPRLRDSLSIALILDNYGLLQFKLYKEGALESMQRALDIRVNSGNSQTTYSSLKNLVLYHKTSNPPMALNYARQANELAKKINNPYYIEDALKLRMSLGQEDVFDEYLMIKDSLEQTKQAEINKFALLKYDVAKKDRAIKEGELRTQIESSKKKTFQLITIFLVVLAVAIYLLLNYRHKRKQLQQVYLTESRISKKVHDEVANDLYRVMSKIQANSHGQTELVDDIDKIYNKTRNISKDLNSIDLDADFAESIVDLLIAYKSADLQIITKGLGSIDWKSISTIKKTGIYRVLQELMTNMKKHSKASIASIRFEENKGSLVIRYNDNGIGTILKKHNGLLNVENRIKALKGTVNFESEINKGFKAIIRL